MRPVFNDTCVKYEPIFVTFFQLRSYLNCEKADTTQHLHLKSIAALPIDSWKKVHFW